MKIGLFGAGGVGKTTLAKALAASDGLVFRQSTTRGVFAKYGKIQKDLPYLDPALRKTIQLANFDAKMAYDAEHAGGVFDRTLLDHMMYLLLYCHDTLTDSEYQHCLFQTWTNLHSYDLLFFFPVYPWPENPEDGFREAGMANRTLQQYILNGLRETIEKRFVDKLRIYTVLDLPVEQRLVELQRHIVMYQNERVADVCVP